MTTAATAPGTWPSTKCYSRPRPTRALRRCAFTPGGPRRCRSVISKRLPISAATRRAATCPWFARRSGGGALVHDRELTYSMALPGDHILAQQTEALYETVHQSLLARALRLRRAGKTVRRLWDVYSLACIRPRTFSLVFKGEPRSTSFSLVKRSAARPSAASAAQWACTAAYCWLAALMPPELPGINELSGVSLDDEKLSAAWAPQAD